MDGQMVRVDKRTHLRIKNLQNLAANQEVKLTLGQVVEIAIEHIPRYFHKIIRGGK